MGTKGFLKSRDERKRVEMRFAHLKIHHGFERMRLRGLSGVRDEFLLAAIVQNLKTLALRTLRPPVAPDCVYHRENEGQTKRPLQPEWPLHLVAQSRQSAQNADFFDSIDPQATSAAQSPSPAKSKMVNSLPLPVRSSTSGWRSVRVVSE